MLEPLRVKINSILGEQWEEWQVPRNADPDWSGEVLRVACYWWAARIARQDAVDSSIAEREPMWKCSMTAHTG